MKPHEARFSCAVCGEAAGSVRLVKGTEPLGDSATAAGTALAELDALVRPVGRAALRVETFFGIGSWPVSADRIDVVAGAVAGADAAALYRIAYSYAPFHCPQCAVSYCGAHWNWRAFDDNAISGIEGDCPRGHFHVLAY
jgi:hypothetical protein